MFSTTSPTIYAPQPGNPALGWSARLLALGIALACAAVLGLAAKLTPAADGVGTHTELGLSRCMWIQQWNLPCPSCGMTTSFAHFAHGNLAASFYVQPMGMVLATLTTAAFWVASYTAVTGKPALRLVRIVPAKYYFLPLMFFAIAAWGWKIFIHLHGMDGW